MENNKDLAIIKADPSTLAATLMAASLEPRTLGDATFLVLPSGYKELDVTKAIEQAQAAPNRKSGTIQLGNIPSLLEYLKDQAAQKKAYVYADIDARSITAVFNDNREHGLPGWRDYRVAYKAEYTPEFQMWMNRNKQKFSQTEFAEFIEDNIADISGDDGALLLKVATTIAATSGINFSSARRLHDGQTQLTYNEVNNAVAGADGSIQIPQKFTLGLRIFKNGAGYAMTARLKYRINSGAVTFFYELERPERSVEDAFNGYVDEVRASGYTVLIGKA